MRVFRYRFTLVFFFFYYTATTEIYSLSLHDALPISVRQSDADFWPSGPPNAGPFSYRLLDRSNGGLWFGGLRCRRADGDSRQILQWCRIAAVDARNARWPAGASFHRQQQRCDAGGYLAHDDH